MHPIHIGAKITTMSFYEEQPYKDGRTVPFIIASVLLIVLAAGCIGLTVYYSSITEPIRTQVTAQADLAAENARQDQFAFDWQEFEAYAASATRVFSSSRDLGLITFEYPVNWSVYIDIDGTSNDTKATYAVYFGDGVVGPIDTSYAPLAVTLERATMPDIMARYERSSSRGASPAVKDDFMANDVVGVRYRGDLYLTGNNTKSGTVIIFQLRDKVLSFFNYDANYESNFYDTVMRTVRWVQ